MYGDDPDHPNSVAEKFYFDLLKDDLMLQGIHFDAIDRGFTRAHRDLWESFDILLSNEEDVFIIEVEHEVRRKDLERLTHRKFANFRKLFPEYGKHNHYLTYIYLKNNTNYFNLRELNCFSVYFQDSRPEKQVPNENVLKSFNRAIDNVRPRLEVKSRRVGGATYQVPVEVKSKRAVTLAMRWLVEFSKKRKEKNVSLRLAFEILEASDDSQITGNSVGKGGSIKKREEVHKMAESNRAFAHYRW